MFRCFFYRLLWETVLKCNVSAGNQATGSQVFGFNGYVSDKISKQRSSTDKSEASVWILEQEATSPKGPGVQEESVLSRVFEKGEKHGICF